MKLTARSVTFALLLGACGDDADDAAPADGSTSATPDAAVVALDASSFDAHVLDSGPSVDAAPTVDVGASPERLVVSDADAERLYVFEGARLVADWPQIAVADHPGFLPLGDGRVVFVDARDQTLVAARIAGVDVPSVEWRTPLPGTVAHLAIDPGARWAVCSSANPGTLTVVTLADGSSKSVPIQTGEPGIAVGGDPLLVFHRNDTPPKFEALSLEALRGGDAGVLFEAAIGEGPHGEVIAHARNKVVSAAADGIYVLPFTQSAFGAATRVPYDVDGLTGGRAFYARLSGDGRYLYSYLRDDGAGTAKWGAFRNDIYIVDLDTNAARRIPVGNGLVYRLGACEQLAAFAQYSPDGDALHLLDARQGSPTFQTLTAKIPLAPLSKAPAADGDVWSSEAFRITTLSSDCKRAYVTHGGDGKVSVVDTSEKRVVGTLTTPTSLAYGGYLVSVRVGQPVFDTIGR